MYMKKQGSKQYVYYNPTYIKTSLYYISKYLYIYNIDIFVYMY